MHTGAMPPRPGAHRRRVSNGPWPRTDWSRKLLVRLVWLYVALYLNVTVGAMGPVQVGAVATAVSLWIYVRTGAPVTLVQVTQRSVTLLLLVVCGFQWQRERLSLSAAGVLVLALATQWWVEEDDKSAVVARAERMHRLLAKRLDAVSAQLAGTEAATITAVAALGSLPPQTVRIEAIRQPRSVRDRTPRPGLHRARRRRPERARRTRDDRWRSRAESRRNSCFRWRDVAVRS